MTAIQKRAVRRSRRVYSERELELRKHHSNVRFLKKWCEQHDLECRDWDHASFTDICVVSLSDYDVHEERTTCVEDNESWFLSPGDYETWCQES
jgi:hypothetical protein